MATTQRMQERLTAIARQLVVEELGDIDDSNAASWLDAVETRAVEIGDALAAELVKQKSQEPPVREDESSCPQCGQLGQYRGQQERGLLTRRTADDHRRTGVLLPLLPQGFFSR